MRIVRWRPKWTFGWLTQSCNFEVLKTVCGEVAVLVLVFPLLDWYLAAPAPLRDSEFRTIRMSPVLALVFLALAIGFAQMEKKYEKIEKGAKD